MKNTLLQNIISNHDMMDDQHFLDWFKQNRQWMLDEELKQNEKVAIDMVLISISKGGKEGVKMEEEFNNYYNRTFNRKI